jgi:hypothetical protein
MQANGKKVSPRQLLKRRSACFRGVSSSRVCPSACWRLVCVCEPTIFHLRHASLLPFFFVSFSGVWTFRLAYIEPLCSIFNTVHHREWCLRLDLAARSRVCMSRSASRRAEKGAAAEKSVSLERNMIWSIWVVYRIRHFFLLLVFRVVRALTPSLVLAEHSRYFAAPIFLRTSSAWRVC